MGAMIGASLPGGAPGALGGGIALGAAAIGGAGLGGGADGAEATCIAGSAAEGAVFMGCSDDGLRVNKGVLGAAAFAGAAAGSSFFCT